jgi:DNA-binding NarL/FixJ family response regulator
MNVLLIEDDKEIYDSIAAGLKRLRTIQILPQSKFDDVRKIFEIYKVDLVILDLNNGNAATADTDAGDKIIREIYRYSFLPVIIFSAFSDIYDNPYKDNYFVKTIKKGPDGINELKKAIKEYHPFIEKRINISHSLNTDVSEIYRNTYQTLIRNIMPKKSSERTEIFTRLIKRRLAASMDTIVGNGAINAWEIYLYPCIGDNFLTGDILKKKKSSKDDPSSYRIILSPSCDLQLGEDRKHIEKVRVACFKKVDSVYKRSQLGESKLRDISPKQYLFFHKLEGIFPHMICDFKDQEIIQFNDLNRKYERIASVDSPFRESIVWADLTINSRLGLPDRDSAKWLNSIKEDCYSENS